MNLHESFSKNIYWPLVQKLKGEYAARALKELSESQWKSQKELLSRQWRLVKRTVSKAVRQVPYYKRICQEIGWKVENDNFSYEDFLNIPPVEKETLRDRLGGRQRPARGLVSPHLSRLANAGVGESAAHYPGLRATRRKLLPSTPSHINPLES